MKRGFNRREAAAYIGRSYSWLAKKGMRGTDDPGYEGPRFIRIGPKGVVYLKEDLDRWLDQWLSGSSTQHAQCSSGAIAGQGG